MVPTLGGGARAGSKEEGRVRSRSVRGDILPLGRLAAYSREVSSILQRLKTSYRCWNSFQNDVLAELEISV